jgi:hypothetical protein
MLLLVLGFGNSAYVEWAANHAKGDTASNLLLRTLAWPKWYVTSGGTASRDVIAYDLRALLLVILVAAILAIFGARVVGGGGAFLLGWSSVIFGAAIATLATAFLTTDASLYNALMGAAQASTYGLFVGWIVGLLGATTQRRVEAVP